MRRMLVSRSSREKPSPLERCVRTTSPSSSGDLAAALQQQRGQHLGRGGFARAAQTGEPDADPLLVARRVHLLQDLGRLRAGEPLRQQLALRQVILAHLGAGDVEDARAFGNLG